MYDFDLYLDVSEHLMRWYEYKITVGPGERIVNTVTAPIYPSIDSNYEPPVYEYTYLLSPAKTWTEFGNLDIVVNTPYYMTESSPEGFEWTNPGYELHFTGLPDGELSFTLCSDSNPKLPFGKMMTMKTVAFLAVLITIVAVVVIIQWGRKDSRKKSE